MNVSSPTGSTSRVRSGWSSAGSMCGYRWFSKVRKNRSSRTSMLDGWTIEASKGSRATRPASSSARMSRSLSSTAGPYARERTMGAMTIRSYVALGDSFTEGVGDPDPTRPNGVRGWADRVAEVIGTVDEGFRYANLAIRGRKLRQVLDEQLEPALALRPELVTLYAGGNDILRPSVDIDVMMAPYADAVAALTGAGVRVLLFTGFDLGEAPLLGRLRGRVAVYNEIVREIADNHGAGIVDFWRMREHRDWRLWDVDRIHMSTLGHRPMAVAGLHVLGGAPHRR